MKKAVKKKSGVRNIFLCEYLRRIPDKTYVHVLFILPFTVREEGKKTDEEKCRKFLNRETVFWLKGQPSVLVTFENNVSKLRNSYINKTS